MYKQLLKSGATALAGYAAKRILSGFNKSPEDKVKEAIQQFKNVVSIDTEEVETDAQQCYFENIGDTVYFDEDYLGSFEDTNEVGKYLLALDNNYSFITNYGSIGNEIVSSLDSIADHYLDYLLSNNKIELFQGLDGVYHVFKVN